MSKPHACALMATGRLHDLDAARAFLMLLILPVHAASMYAHGDGWFVHADESSWLLTGVAAALGMFSMPGFFIVAGILTAIVLFRRDASAWMKGRLIRLGVPLLVSMAVLSPIAIVAGTLAVWDGAPGAAEAGFSVHLSENLLRPGQHWIGHLWFLPTLLVLSAFVWLLAVSGWLEKVTGTLARLALSLRHSALIWGSVLVFCMVWRTGVSGVFYVLENRYGIGLPLNGMIDLRAWAMYMPFFGLGIVVAHSRELFEQLARITPLRLIVVGVSAVAYVSIYAGQSFGIEILKTALKGLLGMGASFLVLAAARRMFTAQNHTVRRLTEASYGIYLFHYPLVVLGGVVMRDVDLPPVMEFAILVSVVFAVSYSLARLVLRIPVLAFAVNGIPLEETRRRNERLIEGYFLKD